MGSLRSGVVSGHRGPATRPVPMLAAPRT